MGRTGRKGGTGGRMKGGVGGMMSVSSEDTLAPQPYPSHRSSRRSSAPMVPADDDAMEVVAPPRRLRRSRSVPAMQQDRMDAEDAPIVLVETTRGQILQRHKKEYRALRDQIAKMKDERRKLSKKDAEQNFQKKEMGKEIKDMQESLSRRHQRELNAFDSGRARKKPTESVHLDLQSINLNFSSLKLK